jgi:hypothetical protein
LPVLVASVRGIFFTATGSRNLKAMRKRHFKVLGRIAMNWKSLLPLGLSLILGLVFTGCSLSNPSSGQVQINAQLLPEGIVGTAYNYSIPASGGTPPYVWSISSSGTLPAGLTMTAKGTIEGTPQTPGTINFTVQVTDSEAVPEGASANLSITVETSLAVTTLSPPLATVGIAYNASLSATGGASPYTWTLQSGNLPAGLNLNSSGVITGTPTTTGSSVFTVQVADSEANQQTATAQLTIAVSIITVTTQSLPAGSINVPYSDALAAIGGTKPYAWSTASTLPLGLVLTTGGVITGTPAATGNYTITVQVADSESPPATANAQLSLTINGGGVPVTLQGNYVFYLNGFNSGGPWTAAGSLITDGSGNITSGVVDANFMTGPVNSAVTGSYTVAPTGLNTMIIQGQSFGPMTLAFVLDSTGNGRVIEYDDTTGQGSRGSGALRKANPTEFTLGLLNGGWAFGMTGAGPNAERYVEAGQFAVSTGNISNGSCAINDGGNSEVCNFTGTVSAIDPQSGRATVTFQTGSGVSHEAVYVVTVGEMVMEETDQVQQGNTYPMLVGSVLEQSGTFTNSSLGGTTVLYMQDINSPSEVDESEAGIVSFDGAGNFNVNVMDDDLAGTITPEQPSQGTYTIDENGVVIMNCVFENCPAAFLVSQNEGFFVSTGTSSSFGIIEPQTGAPFTNASFAGSYVGGSLAPLDYTNAVNEVDVGSADGVSTITLSSYSSRSTGLNQSSADMMNYSIDANGRGTVQAQGEQNPGIVYIISPTKGMILQPTSDARVDLLQH